MAKSLPESRPPKAERCRSNPKVIVVPMEELRKVQVVDSSWVNDAWVRDFRVSYEMPRLPRTVEQLVEEESDGDEA